MLAGRIAKLGATALLFTGCGKPVSTASEAVTRAAPVFANTRQSKGAFEAVRNGDQWLVCAEDDTHNIAIVTVDARHGRTSKAIAADVLVSKPTESFCSAYLSLKAGPLRGVLQPPLPSR